MNLLASKLELRSFIFEKKHPCIHSTCGIWDYKHGPVSIQSWFSISLCYEFVAQGMQFEGGKGVSP